LIASALILFLVINKHVMMWIVTIPVEVVESRHIYKNLCQKEYECYVTILLM